MFNKKIAWSAKYPWRMKWFARLENSTKQVNNQIDDQFIKLH